MCIWWINKMSVPVTAAALLKRAARSASWSLRVDAWKPLTCAAANTSSPAAIATHHPWSCQCNNICDLRPPPPLPRTVKIPASDYDLIAQFSGDPNYQVVEMLSSARTQKPDRHVAEMLSSTRTRKPDL